MRQQGRGAALAWATEPATVRINGCTALTAPVWAAAGPPVSSMTCNNGHRVGSGPVWTGPGADPPPDPPRDLTTGPLRAYRFTRWRLLLNHMAFIPRCVGMSAHWLSAPRGTSARRWAPRS